LSAIRASMNDSLKQWSDSNKSSFVSGLANEIQQPDGDHALYPQLSQVVKEELERTMKPELLNRIDEIVVFSPLRKPELTQIASLIVSRILDRASEEHELLLNVEPNVLEEIVREGSSKADQFGARPIRRAAQRFVEDSLSDAVIQGFLKKGDQGTLSLYATQSTSPTAKNQVVVSRRRDGKTLIVEIEDSSGGIDGVMWGSASSPVDRSESADSATAAAQERTSRL
jgi:C-terminal, D2-small domain, of ClpB protein